jgi:hypothetical protein
LAYGSIRSQFSLPCGLLIGISLSPTPAST